MNSQEEKDFVVLQKQRIRELNAEVVGVSGVSQTDAARARLEALHGRVWSTDELREEFEVIGFCAPAVLVKRKSDGVQGTLLFTHMPRFYFEFEAQA